MLSTPNEILSMIAHALANIDPGSISKQCKGQSPDISNFSLASSRMRQASEPYRFHIVTLDSWQDRHDTLEDLLNRNADLLAGTKHLVLDESCSENYMDIDNASQVLTWLNTPQGLRILRQFARLESVTFWNILRPTTWADLWQSWDPLHLLSSASTLRFHGLVLTTRMASFHAFLGIFPCLEVLECEVVPFGWPDPTDITEEEAATYGRTPVSPRRLRHIADIKAAKLREFCMEINAENVVAYVGYYRVLRPLLSEWVGLGYFQKLKKLTVDFPSDELIGILLEACCATVEAAELSWRQSRPDTSWLHHPQPMPNLRHLSISKLELLPLTTLAETLESLLSVCVCPNLSVTIAGTWDLIMANDFEQDRIFPDEEPRSGWATLDLVLAECSHVSVEFELNVEDLPSAHQPDNESGVAHVRRSLPRCNHRDILGVNLQWHCHDRSKNETDDVPELI